MRQVEERYISLLTDFGFKRIFGTAMNKDLLICFLNSLFDGKQVVKDVSYLNPEHVGDVYTDRKAIFDRLFEEAEIAKFTPQELREYEASKIAYRDIKNSVDTAKREGIAEGMEKKSLEIAKKMLTNGMDEATVMEITGLSAELIQQLKAEM